VSLRTCRGKLFSVAMGQDVPIRDPVVRALQWHLQMIPAYDKLLCTLRATPVDMEQGLLLLYMGLSTLPPARPQGPQFTRSRLP
jgi:hypothetical protein